MMALNQNNRKPKPTNSRSLRKRMVVYARVSTQEQTKGQYPSCDSQIEELEAFCKSRGWEVFESIKDEGHRAGTLQRPGLTRLRWLVETEQVDGVLCTWYNRLIGSRDFYILDKEFKAHNVSFITLHDPADRNTASGRLLESMLVTIKTFENEQIGEKVRTKMRMRAEKGLWNGGFVPFGFQLEEKTGQLIPDPKKLPLLHQMYQVYVDSRSDAVVRDWLKAHNVPAPNGRSVWTAGSLRDLFMNRRYIAEIEINKDKEGIDDLPEFEAYRIVPVPYEPLVPRELWELAQSIRKEKAANAPQSGGKPRSYSQNKCGRIYLLQGHISCGICGHAMTPYYVCHRPNAKEQRRSTSYIHRYACANRIKYRGDCDHKNYVSASNAEAWVLDRIGDLVTSQGVIEEAVEQAYARTTEMFKPTREALSRCSQALLDNQGQIEELIDTARQAKGSLLELLGEKANHLKLERERLRQEQRQLQEQLRPTNDRLDVAAFRGILGQFTLLREHSSPVELQHLLRLVVRKVEWMPESQHHVHYYGLAMEPHNRSGDSGADRQNPLSLSSISGTKPDDGVAARTTVVANH